MDETIMTPIIRTLVLCEMTYELDPTWTPPDRILRGLRVSRDGLNNHIIKLHVARVAVSHATLAGSASVVNVALGPLNKQIESLEEVITRIEKVLASWT